MSIYDNLQKTDDPVQKEPQVQPDRCPQKSRSKSKTLAEPKPSDTAIEGNRRLTIVFIVICTSALGNIFAGQLFNAIEEFIEELRCFAKKKKINISIDTLINAGLVYWWPETAVPLDNYEWCYPNHGGKFSSSKVFDALKRRLKNYENDEYAPILYFFGGKIEANVNSAKYQSLLDHAIFQRAIRNAVPIHSDCITEIYNAFATSPDHVLSELTPECLKKGLILKPLKELVLQNDAPSTLKALTEAEQKIKKIETLYEDSKAQYLALYQKYQSASTDLQLLQNKYNQTWADYNSANNKNSEYLNKIKTIKSENKKLKDDVEQAQEANVVLENAFNALSEQLQSANNIILENEKLRSENESLTHEIALANKKCSDLNKKHQELKASYDVCEIQRDGWMNKCDAVCAERDGWIRQYNSKSTELAELKNASVKQLSRDDIINLARNWVMKSDDAHMISLRNETGMFPKEAFSDADQIHIDDVTRTAIEDMTHSFQRLLSESKGKLEYYRFPELEGAIQIALKNFRDKSEKTLNSYKDKYDLAIIFSETGIALRASEERVNIPLENDTLKLEHNADIAKNDGCLSIILYIIGNIFLVIIVFGIIVAILSAISSC